MNSTNENSTTPMDFATDIHQACDCMRAGGVILYPTDTIWGLGCDATNTEAVRRIFEIKRRQEAKAMISLVADVDMLWRFAEDIPEAAEQIFELATTPVTVILDHPMGISRALIAPDGSAAFRCTSERYSRELCRRMRRPVVSTSANISGEKPAPYFSQISREIVDAVDYVATYRRDDHTPHTPSSILKISSDSTIKIIR